MCGLSAERCLNSDSTGTCARLHMWAPHPRGEVKGRRRARKTREPRLGAVSHNVPLCYKYAVLTVLSVGIKGAKSQVVAGALLFLFRKRERALSILVPRPHAVTRVGRRDTRRGLAHEEKCPAVPPRRSSNRQSNFKKVILFVVHQAPKSTTSILCNHTL